MSPNLSTETNLKVGADVYTRLKLTQLCTSGPARTCVQCAFFYYYLNLDNAITIAKGWFD